MRLIIAATMTAVLAGAALPALSGPQQNGRNQGGDIIEQPSPPQQGKKRSQATEEERIRQQNELQQQRNQAQPGTPQQQRIENQERERNENTVRSRLSDNDVRRGLENDGYKVERFRREGNELEADAVRDGRRWKLKLDPETGKVQERSLYQ